MLKVLGVGLPRTGTATLAKALRMLGFATVHHDRKRFALWPANRDIRDVAVGGTDAIVDLPTALYWRELLRANPGCKAILTIRDPDGWWESIKWHINTIHASADLEHIHYSNQLHSLLFGSPYPNEYWFKRRYDEWTGMIYEWFRQRGELEQFLVLDIVAGHKWDKLCPFLGVEEPDAEWPWLNKKAV